MITAMHLVAVGSLCVVVVAIILAVFLGDE